VPSACSSVASAAVVSTSSVFSMNSTVLAFSAKEFERLKKCGVLVNAENQPSKVDFVNNAVFQFPQDDEIEV
jgi:hypothetical protein